MHANERKEFARLLLLCKQIKYISKYGSEGEGEDVVSHVMISQVKCMRRQVCTDEEEENETKGLNWWSLLWH